MAQEEKERFVIPDENGTEHLFDELFRFTVDETEKSYMVLVPVGEEEDDEEEAYDTYREHKASIRRNC